LRDRRAIGADFSGKRAAVRLRQPHRVGQPLTEDRSAFTFVHFSIIYDFYHHIKDFAA
jgi:hypothetical protein